jgi:hypothetical protein
LTGSNGEQRTLLEAERELERVVERSVLAERRVAEARNEVTSRTEELLEALHAASRLRSKIGRLRARLQGSPSSVREVAPLSSRRA